MNKEEIVQSLVDAALIMPQLFILSTSDLKELLKITGIFTAVLLLLNVLGIPTVFNAGGAVLATAVLASFYIVEENTVSIVNTAINLKERAVQHVTEVKGRIESNTKVD